MQKTRIKETTMITLWAYQRLVSNNWCPLIFFVGAPLAEALTVDEDGLCLCGLSVLWPSRGKRWETAGSTAVQGPQSGHNPTGNSCFRANISQNHWSYLLSTADGLVVSRHTNYAQLIHKTWPKKHMDLDQCPDKGAPQKRQNSNSSLVTILLGFCFSFFIGLTN